MKIVVFGLTVSSSWGNGHATLWRGLVSALARRGHRVVFFEKDVPYYAQHRDLHELPGGELVLYGSWEDVSSRAQQEVRDADVAMVTSYCPDGIAATQLVLESRATHRLFYDMDTPVTLQALRAGREVPYIGPDGLGGFDLVLSYTGGTALTALTRELGARRVAPLYGHVDPAVHHPVEPLDDLRCDLSYLGTYAADRQRWVDELLIEPARQRPDAHFLIGGSMYPNGFPPVPNVRLMTHVPPPTHPAFYCSGRMTLNVTRQAMAEMGYCPSGRLFEAAACGVPIVSDAWQGLSSFFEPGSEILVCESARDVLDALDLDDTQLARMARRARERTLQEHTSEVRALELEALLSNSARPSHVNELRPSQGASTCGE